MDFNMFNGLDKAFYSLSILAGIGMLSIILTICYIIYWIIFHIKIV